MESLKLVPDLEQTGFKEGEYLVVAHQGDVVIGGMPNGTESGKPIVMIGLETDAVGGFLVAETTLSLFLTAADALKAKYGDPRQSERETQI